MKGLKIVSIGAPSVSRELPGLIVLILPGSGSSLYPAAIIFFSFFFLQTSFLLVSHVLYFLTYYPL